MVNVDFSACISGFPDSGMTGRRKIFTNVSEVTAGNVIDVLSAALPIHNANVAEINYLFDCYRGRQDIRNKQKFVREKINEKIVVNRAKETVEFYSSMLLEEPIQYISHVGDEGVISRVNRLNEIMRAAGKEFCDKRIVDWFLICGVAPRLSIASGNDVFAPISMYAVDPRRAFVIYNSGVEEKSVAGVVIGSNSEGRTTFDVYTGPKHFLVCDGAVSLLSAPNYKHVPLTEYFCNFSRMSVFESGISVLNAINKLESNALDNVEDFVNAFDVFENCDIEDGEYSQLAIGGKAIRVKTTSPGSPARVYRVSSEINQGGVQTRIDDLTAAYLEVCGMPNRNGVGSTSDTGQAVYLRDGFASAVSRAKDMETLFRQSEREMCKVVLDICETNGIEVPRIFDFEPEFLAHKFSNLQSRAQALCEMLNNPKIHPKHAYAAAGSGLFDDIEAAYRDGMQWMEEQQKREEAVLMEGVVKHEETSVSV